MREMTSRQRVLTTLGFGEPDKVPVTLAYETPESLCRSFGREEFIGRFRHDLTICGFKSGRPASRIRADYLPDLPAGAVVDHWGVGHLRSSTGDSYSVFSPLAGVETEEDIKAYPFPDVSVPALSAHLDREVSERHQQGLAVQGAMSQTIFELAWQMVGMEKFLVTLVENPRPMELLLDVLTDLRVVMARRFVEAGVDILRLGDDVGSQKGMLLRPAMWRQFLKPRLARIIREARKVQPGIPILYHSDGDVREIIPELIEIGVTILNPIQPECMDPVEIKRKYGQQLTLNGTIGTQDVLPFGSPDDVRASVARMCREVGKGGGFIIMPTHTIERDVPWDNVVAFYQAVEEFGAYGARS